MLYDETVEDMDIVERETLGKRIRDRRIELGLTQEDVAKLWGIKQAVISRYESGERGISATDLPRWAEILQAPIIYFFQTEDKYSASAPDAIMDKWGLLSAEDKAEISMLIEHKLNRGAAGTTVHQFMEKLEDEIRQMPEEEQRAERDRLAKLIIKKHKEEHQQTIDKNISETDLSSV